MLFILSIPFLYYFAISFHHHPSQNMHENLHAFLVRCMCVLKYYFHSIHIFGRLFVSSICYLLFENGTAIFEKECTTKEICVLVLVLA